MDDITNALDEVLTAYFRKEDSHLAAVAERIRSHHSKIPNAIIGEIYRHAMLGAFRQAREAKSERDKMDFYALGLTWKSRARVIFNLSGSRTGEAMMLIPDAYAVAMEFGRFDLAREILHEMPALIDADEGNEEDAVPSRALVRRCYPEKVGYLYFLQQNYADGEQWYQRALKEAQGDPRGRLKVQLGLIVCRFGASHGDSGRNEVLAEMRKVADEANSSGFRDVLVVAEKNCELLSSSSEIEPFELSGVEI
jgi:hypothetical protein